MPSVAQPVIKTPFHLNFQFSLRLFSEDMKDHDFYQLTNILSVDICDFSEDHITFHDKCMQKTKKLQSVPLLFHATVYDHWKTGLLPVTLLKKFYAHIICAFCVNSS